MVMVSSCMWIIFVSLSIVSSQKIVKEGKCEIKTDEEMASFINDEISCEVIVDYIDDNLLSLERECKALNTKETGCEWMEDDWQCGGTSTISKLKEKNAIKFAEKCGSIVSVTDNKVKECMDHFAKLTGKKSKICKLETVEPYTAMFAIRKAIFSSANDLNILEKYVLGPLGESTITMSLIEFEDIGDLERNEGKPEAHTEPLPVGEEVELVQTELAKDNSLDNNIGEKDKTITINIGKHHFGEYDLRKKVKPEDALITEHQWNNFGQVNILSFGEVSICSATLIAPNWILFAAHCVVTKETYNDAHAIKPIKHIRFVFGFNGDGQADKFKTEGGEYRTLIEIYVPIGYMSSQFTQFTDQFKDEYDYALGKLDGAPFEHYMSIGYDSNDVFWKETVFDTAGYPGDLPGVLGDDNPKGNWLYFSPHSFKKADIEEYEEKASTLKYKEPVRAELVQDLQRFSYAGQSGSAVWAYKDNINQIMGILNSGCVECFDHRFRKKRKLKKENHEYKRENRGYKRLFGRTGKCHNWKEKEVSNPELAEECAQKERKMRYNERKIRENDIVLKWMEDTLKASFGTQVVRISAPKFWRWIHLLGLDAAKSGDEEARAQQHYYNMYMDDDIYDGVYDDRYDDMNEYIKTYNPIFMIESITIITMFGFIFCFILGGFLVFSICKIFDKNTNDQYLDNITDDTDIQV